MSDYMPYIVVGLVTGAIYGLAGVGLVLTYKTSGIFNFAHGAVAAFGAFFFFWLTVDHDMPWGWALFITVVGLGTVTGLVLERFARHLTAMSTALKIVATVGVVLIVQGLGSLKYKPGKAIVPQFLSTGRAFRLFEVNISWSDVIITIAGVSITTTLYVFFRISRLGVAMRAVVDDADLLDMAGTDPVTIRRWSWIIGTMLAMLSGVLISQGSNLDAIALTFLIVQAFGAAAIGLFSSVPLTYLGGSVIGVLVALSQKQFSANKYFSGLPSAIPVVALFLILILVPRGRLVSATTQRRRPKPVWQAPARVRLLSGVIVVAVLAYVPELVGTKLDAYSSALAHVILFLSLGLLVKTSGQVSLCHMAFAAVGAAAFSQFRAEHGLPWLVALLLAGLVAIPVGAVVAIPAIRLSGLYLALATLGFGIVMERFFYPLGIMFTTKITGRSMPRPSFGDTDRSYYYVLLIFAVLTALAMVAIHEGRLGRLLRGMSDSPTALETLGLSVRNTRVIVFCISAFFAAIAGALYGGLFGRVAGAQFSPFKSLVLLALLTLNPFGAPWYALPCAAGLVVVPVYFNDTTGDVTNRLNVLFGFFAVLVAVQGGTQPAPARVQQFFARFGRAKTGTAPAGPTKRPADLPVATAPEGAAPSPAGLEVQQLTVKFGGLTAVNSFSMQAPMNQITGLIGPNGAGKTTTFNACSGLTRPSSGRILLHGKDITSLDPPARGRSGLGRTFQRMELFDTLSVEANVALGREAAMAGTAPHRQLIATPSDRREVEWRAWSALELCGIQSLATQQAGSLSTGQRRLVELARCLAGQFDVLLLDEPSSGLDRDETRHFGDILTRVVADRKVGILLVEHDMSLVMDICRYIYVLDFGQLIAEGSPATIAASAVVQAAYLGTEAIVVPGNPQPD